MSAHDESQNVRLHLVHIPPSVPGMRSRLEAEGGNMNPSDLAELARAKEDLLRVRPALLILAVDLVGVPPFN